MLNYLILSLILASYFCIRLKFGVISFVFLQARCNFFHYENSIVPYLETVVFVRFHIYRNDLIISSFCTSLSKIDLLNSFSQTWVD